MKGDSSNTTLPNSFPVQGPETLLAADPLDISDENLWQKSDSPNSSAADLCVVSAAVSSCELQTYNGDSVPHGSDKIGISEKNKFPCSADQTIADSSEDILSWSGGGTKTNSEIFAPPTTSSNRAPIAALQSTPLSSLPPGSLMRHLVALREKQYLQSHDLLSGLPQVQCSVLTQGKKTAPAVIRTSVAKFSTSTPQLGFESLRSGHDGQGATRYPLTELPLTVSSNIKNTTPPSDVGHNHKLATSSRPLIIAEENPTVALADHPVSRLYNPNTYRSPPKLISNSDTKKFPNPEHQCRVDSYSITNSAASLKTADPALARQLTTKSTDSPRDDDRPLSTSNKSFEELLSEKLEDKSYFPSSSARPILGKKFLKKGSGISRFSKAGSSSTNAEKSLKNGPSLNDTSIPAKAKFPFLKKGTGNRRFNVKSVKLKKSCKTQKFSPITENVDQGAASHKTEDVRYVNAPNESPNINLENELDFMSPIRKISSHRESEELKAFEALEELAEHSSFCSDASTVNSLLRRGLEYSVSSTPAGSPSTRLRRYPASILEFEARRMEMCTDSPHPQRGGFRSAVGLEESAGVNDSENGGLKAKKSVQFCKQGAQILEYRADEDILNEAPPSSDASDLFSVSDLEILNQMNSEGKLPAALRIESVAGSKKEDPTTDMQEDLRSSRHQVLQFSPPKIPPDAASYAVWEAFGKKSKRPPARQPGVTSNTTAKLAEDTRHVSGTGAQNNCAEELLGAVHRHKEEELEAHKVLLVSKVHELEKEIKTFQNENAALGKLRKTFAREKELFEREKRLFDESIRRERKNLEEQFEAERNRLWREKCSLESNKQIKPQNDNVLEIINLKEEVLMLKNELERRDSMNNFTVNKLKNKVKELTSEKKDLESKVQKISFLEKENMSLKHQVDRLKLTSRTVCDKSTAKPATTVYRTSSAPAANAVRSQTQGNPMSKARCEDALIHKSVSFVDEKLSNPEKNSSGKNMSADRSAETKKPLSFTDSYLANFSCSESVTATSASNAVSSALDQSCTEENMSDGSKIITYANGNKKQILPSGCIIDEYYNGDRKETYRDRVVYFYSFNGTKQTTYLDGSEELHFPNGQTEIKRADTSIEVIFPDLSKTVKLPDGTEVHHNSDGTVVTSTPSGEKVIKFPSGQREVHGLGFKRREYPDGTAKVLYDDGSSETTYPNGRIRVKDQHGNIVSDTKLGLDLIEKCPS